MTQQKYVNFEYMSVKASRKNAGEITNRYQSLGWEVDRIENRKLVFKRDYEVRNKSRLTLLQAKIEDGINVVDSLQKSKKKKAKTLGIILGNIAALVFGGGMSLVMANASPITASAGFIGGIALGAAGAALAALNYPLYKRNVYEKTTRTNPLIERKKNELAELCGEAHRLAAAV